MRLQEIMQMMPRIFSLFLLLLVGMLSYPVVARDVMRHQRYTTQDGLSHRVISAFMQDSVGNIWMSTWNGLCRFDGETFSTFDMTTEGEKVGRLALVRLTRDNRVWCIRQNDSQEFLLDEVTGRLYPIAQGSVKTRGVNRISHENDVDSTGVRIWHDSTLYLLPHEGAGQVANTRYTAIADRQGVIWANFDDALYQISFGQAPYEHIDRLDPTHGNETRYGNEIRAILHLRDGGYLIACKNLCIYKYSDEWRLEGYLTPRGEVVSSCTEFGTRIYAMTQAADGTVWMGSRGNGLFAVSSPWLDSRVMGQKPSVRNFREPLVRNDNIFDVVSANGNRLFVATWKGGVQLFDTSDDNCIRSLAHADSSISKVRRIVPLHPHLNALCSTQGIWFTDEHLHTVGHLGTMDISDLKCGADGTCYVATLADGVCTFRLPDAPSATDFAQMQLQKLDVPQIDNIVLSIARTPDDWFWFVSDDALTCYHPASRQTRHIDWQAFGMEVTFGEAQPLVQDGLLVLGTTSGRMQISLAAPTGYCPVLTLNVADTLHLSWGDTAHGIRATAIDYRLPRLVQYAWRECPDSVWHDLGDNGTLPDLQLWPGTHRLEIRSTDAQGLWADNVRRVTVVVSVAVWQQVTLSIIFVVLALLFYLAWLVHRRRTSQVIHAAPVITGIQPSQPIVESRDQRFIERVTELVERNIEDSQFDVDRMAASMDVSRTVLYSKFKELLDTTPGAFINEIRLKRAIQLLNTRQYQVQEVAYKCGWENRRYFARCFRQKMGMTPSQYLERVEKK